jgi:hypothetical protein
VSQFHLSFSVPFQEHKINHKEFILFLGSCFSDEIAAKAKFNGFQVDSNPFGTVFHPLALGRFLLDCLTEQKSEEFIFQREDLFFTLDASTTLYATSQNDLTVKLTELRNNWLNQLKSASHLFVTFGTAWGYQHIESQLLVANCHKLPSQQFVKSLTSSDEITNVWNLILEKLNVLNPNLTVCFTVSPVRHIKDGFVESNQSKAVLIESVRRLQENSKVIYFPSYEIVMDELRDYRFFKQDRVHPNDEAIDYVWNRFVESFCSNETLELCKKLKSLKLALSHKSLHPESQETLAHKKKVEQLCNEFKAVYPFIFLD